MMETGDFSEIVEAILFNLKIFESKESKEVI